jgi:hypothetical protein
LQPSAHLPSTCRRGQLRSPGPDGTTRQPRVDRRPHLVRKRHHHPPPSPEDDCHAQHQPEESATPGSTSTPTKASLAAALLHGLGNLLLASSPTAEAEGHPDVIRLILWWVIAIALVARNGPNLGSRTRHKESGDSNREPEHTLNPRCRPPLRPGAGRRGPPPRLPRPAAPRDPVTGLRGTSALPARGGGRPRSPAG